MCVSGWRLCYGLEKVQDVGHGKKGERFYLFNQYQITMFPCRWCSTCVATDLDFSRESGSVIADKMSFRWR